MGHRWGIVGQRRASVLGKNRYWLAFLHKTKTQKGRGVRGCGMQKGRIGGGCVLAKAPPCTQKKAPTSEACCGD